MRSSGAGLAGRMVAVAGAEVGYGLIDDEVDWAERTALASDPGRGGDGGRGSTDTPGSC